MSRRRYICVYTYICTCLCIYVYIYLPFSLFFSLSLSLSLSLYIDTYITYIDTYITYHNFHAVVTPTVLYGSGSWAMTGEREALLRTTQLKMLRKVLGKQRLVLSEGDLETWVEWIKRSTAEVRQLIVAHKIPNLVTEHHVRVKK